MDNASSVDHAGDGLPLKGTAGNDAENPESEIPLEELPSEFRELLDKLPSEEKERALAVLISSVRRSTYLSPVPPPEILKGYNDVIPNGAERILAMTEKAIGAPYVHGKPHDCGRTKAK